MTRIQYTPLLIIIVIAAALINNSLFGSASLAAYFFYTIFASILSVLIFATFLFSKQRASLKLPIFLLVFAGLALYIYLHGFLTNTIGLTHYYWAVCAVFIIALFMWQQQLSPETYSRAMIKIHQGIIVLAILESGIVLLQFVKIIPVTNSFFRCTGTWVNPNVTALFLAFSIYSFANCGWRKQKPILFKTLLAATVVAIVLLQCRTAYLVAAIMITGIYINDIKHFAFNKLRLSKTAIIATGIITAIVFVAVVSFSFKTESTNGRVLVWKNSLGLIAQKPVTGFGFGMYEKEYNLHVATNQLPSKGHVNMAYNDFLELGVEGGGVAVILWVAFLISYGWYCYKQKYSLLPLMGLVVMQVTNFGFQAIPAFVLVLVYTSTNKGFNVAGIFRGLNLSNLKIGLLFFIAVLLFYLQSDTAATYKLVKRAEMSYKETGEIEEYAIIKKKIINYPIYNEDYGDFLYNNKNFKAAINQYKCALNWASYSKLFLKCGMGYQQLKRYDSSLYYYKLAERIEPDMYIPKSSILSLFVEQKDSLNAIDKANEILRMPVKIEGKEVDRIKKFAKAVINKYDL